MDEPTSGLDARAAAIIVRTVCNTLDTARTVVCTVHRPSIDIFESFHELVLMKRGAQIIYYGPLGRNSQNILEYFDVRICRQGITVSVDQSLPVQRKGAGFLILGLLY
ncbi:hypothetical protein KI387_039045, partial [Taxus chinensis]